MSWRLLGTCCLLLQLLQLLVLAPCCLAGPFDSFIINPKSYLDVIRPASRSNTAAGADPPPSSSSCRDSSSAPCQPAAQISSSSSSRSAGSAAQQSRGLQQAANPARLLPPYNVCVFSWAPMVRCTPGADQSEFQGAATLECPVCVGPWAVSNVCVLSTAGAVVHLPAQLEPPKLKLMPIAHVPSQHLLLQGTKLSCSA